LIRQGSFTELLLSLRDTPAQFVPMVQNLWQTMNSGGFSIAIRQDVLRFNGGLFKDAAALPLTSEQIDLLIRSARADWRHVEPAIFGTLLERALDPLERHKLGAHYTPRAYVERLVMPTVIEPLREDWSVVQAAALALHKQGKPDKAIAQVQAFHRQLCETRVLDPACGSGNFLYVTLEHMKRLEGEVLNTLHDMGQSQGLLQMEGISVDPHQFLGLEVNPRAAAIAEMVLWIGYLQWHFRTQGPGQGKVQPPNPVLKDFHNIENRDAVLAWDAMEYVADEAGRPVTRWDGRTTKPDPITGRPVPDESARVPLERYIKPRKAEWPKADFVVGNPPFIGAGPLRQALGDGYAETLRKVWSPSPSGRGAGGEGSGVPESADFVMYWWHHAAGLARAAKLRRFGFITTNSLRQTFNRRVLEAHLAAKKPLSVVYAIPDHPWVDAQEGAAVRIAMTVAEGGEHEGALRTVEHERRGDDEGRDIKLNRRQGRIFADLKIGANVAAAVPLGANTAISSRGMQLIGSGFIVTKDEAEALIGPPLPPGEGRGGEGPTLNNHPIIRQYRNGKDLTQTPRGVYVIDLFGLSADEARDRHPAIYQWVLERVKPERDAKAHTKDGAGYAKHWCWFGKPRQELRRYLDGLPRYIATVETSKHRVFTFLDQDILPDNKLVNIALDDAYHLGVLQSRVHVLWALASGGNLGVGNDPVYVKTRCFETFPFPATPRRSALPGANNPDPTPGDDGFAPGKALLRGGDTAAAAVAVIRDLAEKLDAHRKRQQAQHPGLTLTGLYNVLEKLRASEGMNLAPVKPGPDPDNPFALTDKERQIHEQGLVSVLRQYHEELDAAVFAAYGWDGLWAAYTEARRLPDPGARREAVAAVDEQVLQSLVNLNTERAAEEGRGHIRWLRHEFQNPGATQTEAAVGAPFQARTAKPASTTKTRPPWPKTLTEQFAALKDAVAAHHGPANADQIARQFNRAPTKKVAELLEVLVSLGQIKHSADGYAR
ncbi:MAG: class I SAM-dependent DNA methyltransferase, partial [Gammaproteobacteria bacterium]